MSEGIIKGTAVKIDVVDKRLFRKPEEHAVVPAKEIDEANGIITIDFSAGGIIGLMDPPIGGEVEVGVKDNGLPYVTFRHDFDVKGETVVLDAENPIHKVSSETRTITVEFKGVRVGKNNNP